MFVKSEVRWIIVVPADPRLPNKLLYLAVLGEEGEEGPVHMENVHSSVQGLWFRSFFDDKFRSWGSQFPDEFI